MWLHSISRHGHGGNSVAATFCGRSKVFLLSIAVSLLLQCTLILVEATVATGVSVTADASRRRCPKDCKQWLNKRLTRSLAEFSAKMESGAHGTPGAVGSPGPRGPMGFPGPQGPRGWQGERGVAGRSGRPGVDGFPGYNGIPGSTGPSGPRGPRGHKGIEGEKGDQGIIGLVGPKGSRGDIGEPGEPLRLPRCREDQYVTSDGNYLVCRDFQERPCHCDAHGSPQPDNHGPPREVDSSVVETATVIPSTVDSELEVATADASINNGNAVHTHGNGSVLELITGAAPHVVPAINLPDEVHLP